MGTKEAKDLTWSNVNFFISNNAILRDCWGEVKVGQVTAILGPSGAGKSSLLNVLAGRTISAGSTAISGLIKVGGAEINPIQYRRNIAYVMQDDCLLATATPREALRFSASLRLPSTFTSVEITNRVETLLSELGLVECADVYIGDILKQGISGGQRKRTSVGIEIVIDPVLLFLDEPTSGLDSFSAYNLIQLLKRIASNCAILCTIHQPSADIFLLFDKVIFMKDGQVLYQGPAIDIESFFAIRGYECPENHNPCDFVMNICQSQNQEDLKEKNLFMEIPDEVSSEKYSVKAYDSNSISFGCEASFTQQFTALMYRGFTDTIRNYSFLLARSIRNIILGLLYGLIFMNIGNQSNDVNDNVNSHVGAISMIMTISVYFIAQTGMMTFQLERPMILREYVTGTYDLPACFLAKTCIELPLNFILQLKFFIYCFFLMGLQGNFLYLLVTSWLVAISCNSLALVLGAAVTNATTVVQLTGLLLSPQMLFSGVYISTENIPIVLRWVQYLCSMKYGMGIALYNEFHPSLPSCDENTAAAMNCAAVLDSNNIRATSIALYVGCLVVLFVGFRILAVFVLYQRAKRFY